MDGLMELPGMAFEELASSGPRSLFGTSSEASLHPPASALCGLEITANCLHGSTLDPDSLESTLHQSAVEGAFTYESMDAPSPEINEIHEPSPETAFSMGMSSLQAYASAAFENSNSGSADPNLFADPSKDAATAAAMSTAAVVDGTQSASAAPQSLDSAEMYSIEQQSAQPSSSGPDSGIVPDTPQPTSALPNSDASERKIVRKKRFFTIRDFEGLALPSISEIRDMQETQKMYVHSQMEELHRLLRVQHKLTGVNPLSQELNTWVLGLKAVKKTEESLSQEALAMLRNVYAIKDIVTKKEAFELSVLTGSTQTQVRDFFAAQQSRVKKILKNSEEEMGRTGGRNAVEQSHVQSSAMDAATSNRSNSADSFEKLLDLMRSENSFTGQTRLLQIILQAEPGPMLRLFLDKGGLRIISKWLVQAAVEEQTSLIRQLLKALVHLPMIHAIPGQVSPIVQTVNRLRTYFAADVGNQARSLLMSWTKLYARTKVTRILSALIDPPLVQKEKAVESDKQNSSGVSQPDQKKMKIEKSSADSTKVSAVGKPQGLTNKVIANDKSGKPILNTLRRSIQTIEDPGLTNPNPKKRLAPDHGKERRQVVLVDDGTNKRVSEGRRSVDKSSRPLSADDIQKAKMRARLLQGSTSKPRASDTPQLQNQSSQLPPPPPPPPPIVPSSSLRRYVLPEATVTATSSSSAAAATTTTTAAATASAAKSGYYSDEKLRLGTTGIEMSRTGAGGQLQANPILLSTALEGLLPFLTSQANANANVDDNTKIPSFPANTQNVNIEQRITEVGVAAAVGDREDGQKLVEQEEKEGKEKEEEEEAKQRKEEAVVAVAVVDASSELPVRVIPWALPPEIRSDALWSVAGGEDSKEREIQTLRVKREEEEFYSHPSFIPLNPKDPWDEEQEYDDSLTLVVPLESQKDDDVDGGGGDGGDVKNIRSHDPQLLALLLSNPTLVSHLSSKDAAAQQRRSADVSYAQGQGHHHQQQQQQHLHSLPLPSLSLPLPSLSLPLPSAAHHQFATSAYASQYIPQQQQEYRDWGNRLPPQQQQQQQQQQQHHPPHHQYGQYQQQPHQQQSWFNPSMVPPNWRAP